MRDDVEKQWEEQQQNEEHQQMRRWQQQHKNLTRGSLKQSNTTESFWLLILKNNYKINYKKIDYKINYNKKNGYKINYNKKKKKWLQNQL